MKPITVEDYKEVADEFFEKYHFVVKELGEDAKPEQVLKVMESLGGLVMKKRSEDQGAPLIGFNKKDGIPTTTVIGGPPASENF